MGARRFKTALGSQVKNYGTGSGRTTLSASASGGSVTQSGGFSIHTFSFTGSDQSFSIISPGLFEFFIWGAAGGGSNAEGYSDPGGAGGYAYGTMNISAGTSIVVQVGGGGGIVSGGGTTRPSRPYPNGGLPSTRSGYVSGAGGGRSALFISSVSPTNALLIAGGGGGAAGHGGGSGYANEGGHGGCGGGTNGESGYSTYVSETANGASQSSAGTSSTSPNTGSQVAGQLAGGDAGNGTAWSTGWNAAGGGGDGWYGGGAIEGRHQGGGGGSGYFNTNYILNASLQSNTTSNTRISNTLPAQTSNQFYQTGIGRGNANAAGGNGLVVIRYSLSASYIFD